MQRFCLLLGLLLSFATSAHAQTPLQRGAYLVESIANCGNCHAPQDATGAKPLAALSGGPAIEAPAFTAYPPNITPDHDTGIGGWTEDQVVTALRDGRAPDGHVLRPPMPVPFYRGMSDEDAHAIAAYLLSRPAVTNAVPKSVYKGRMPASYGPPVGHVPSPPRNEPAVYGAYLGNMGHCLLCHTPLDAKGQPDVAHRLGAGGRVLRGVFGQVVTSNITPDKETGIGAWTDVQLSKALTTGERPDGRHLQSPMPVAYLARMNLEDIAALITWLRSLPPVANKIEH